MTDPENSSDHLLWSWCCNQAFENLQAFVWISEQPLFTAHFVPSAPPETPPSPLSLSLFVFLSLLHKLYRIWICFLDFISWSAVLLYSTYSNLPTASEKFHCYRVFSSINTTIFQEIVVMPTVQNSFTILMNISTWLLTKFKLTHDY